MLQEFKKKQILGKAVRGAKAAARVTEAVISPAKTIVNTVKKASPAIKGAVKTGANAVKKEIDSVKKAAFPTSMDPRFKKIPSIMSSADSISKKYSNLKV